jgi:hypothetical protein
MKTQSYEFLENKNAGISSRLFAINPNHYRISYLFTFLDFNRETNSYTKSINSNGTINRTSNLLKKIPISSILQSKF